MVAKRVTSREVDCPTCGAGQGEKCRGSAYSGRAHRSVDYHHARREAARAAQADGETQETADTGQETLSL